MQIQNLPADEDTRGAFVPEKGNMMVSCDYSALESRLGADIYNEKHMIDEFLYGSGDIHSLMAITFFGDQMEPGITTKEVKDKYPKLRKDAKSPEFLIQFGGSAHGLSTQLAIPKATAEKYVENYYNKFKGIAAFKEKGFKDVCKNGYVLICKHTGHRTYMPDWPEWRKAMDDEDFWNRYDYLHDTLSYKEFVHTPEYHKASELRRGTSKWSRMVLNSPTQGTGIIILKDAMSSFFKWIVKNNLFGKVLICDLVHDEAVIEYPRELIDVPQILKELMEKSAAKFCKKLPIPAAPEVGTHWIH